MLNRIDKVKIALAIIVIATSAFCAFVPSLKNDFVKWDDDIYVTENLFIQSPDLSLKDIFSSFTLGHYHPLTTLSYVLEFKNFGLNPYFYHLDNLLLHILTCILVFYFIFLLSGRKILVAFITALFFGIHPMQVETVAWISERKNILYVFFFLASIISYLYFLRKQNIKSKFYFFSLLFFILSLLSKSMAITLPFVLFLIDYFYGRKLNRNLFFEKIPFLVLSLVFTGIALFAAFNGEVIRDEKIFSLIRLIFVVFYGPVFYFSKILLPVNLSALYLYYGIKQFGPFLYAIGTAVILITGILLSKKYTKKIMFAGCFFLIILSPALQIIPNGEIIVADRYVYLPSVAIFYLFAEGFYWFLKKKSRFDRQKAAISFIAIIILSSMLVFSTRSRCLIWKNTITLWSDVIEKHPFAISAYINRGSEYLINRDYSGAYKDFMSALAIDKNDFKVYANLATFYAYLGKFEESITNAKKALEINPKSALTHYTLSVNYFYKKNYALAKEHCLYAKSLGFDVPAAFLKELALASKDIKTKK